MKHNNPKEYRRERTVCMAAVIVVCAFFLPWFDLRCCEQWLVAIDGNHSGYRLARDLPDYSVFGVQPTPLLFIVPIMALGAALIASAYYFNLLKQKQANILYFVLGAEGIVIQIWKYLRLKAYYSHDLNVYSVRPQIGWWLTLLAFLVILGAHRVLNSAVRRIFLKSSNDAASLTQ